MEKTPQKTWSFYRTIQTDDAPVAEDWTYVYTVIPMGWNTFIVTARRYNTADIFYQRMLTVSQWFDGWFKFQGERI